EDPVHRLARALELDERGLAVGVDALGGRQLAEDQAPVDDVRLVPVERTHRRARGAAAFLVVLSAVARAAERSREGPDRAAEVHAGVRDGGERALRPLPDEDHAALDPRG